MEVVYTGFKPLPTPLNIGNMQTLRGKEIENRMLRDKNKPLLTIEETIKCYDRCPREEQFIREAKESIPIEKVEELYLFLQGNLPECIHMKRPPRLSKVMAFRIIWFLQEQTHVLPDKFERCRTCGNIFNSESEGDRELSHCDWCRRDL
jgi:hypothetical protein